MRVLVGFDEVLNVCSQVVAELVILEYVVLGHCIITNSIDVGMYCCNDVYDDVLCLDIDVFGLICKMDRSYFDGQL